VESWFRIELVLALVDAGLDLQYIDFDCNYPGSQGKGDLAINSPEFRAVFELKSFACFADANKIAAFPSQVHRLAALVGTGAISQGLAFCTFCGHKDGRISSLRQKFFDNSWTLFGPRPILKDAPLFFHQNPTLNPRPESPPRPPMRGLFTSVPSDEAL
jgi:hypothetical protein